MDTIKRERLDSWSKGVLIISLLLLSGVLNHYMPRREAQTVSFAIASLCFLVSFVRSSRSVLTITFFTLLMSAWAYFYVWPRDIPFAPLVPLLGFIVVVRFTRLHHRVFPLLRAGSLDRSILPLLALVVVLSGVGLVAWFRFADPDFDGFREMISQGQLGLIIAARLAFAVINAVIEEAIYRGVVQGILESAFGFTWFPLIVQAMVFGHVHFQGIMSGWSGVFLATAYGLLLGLMKRRGGGLAAPVLAHVFADLTIFAVLAKFVA